MKTSQPCQVHKRHSPPTHVNEIHHIWPLGNDGPNVLGNKVTVCATGHNSIHQLLAEWLRLDAKPSWLFRRRYTSGERMLAQLGYERIKRKAL
jgi:hypothetical protein